MSRPALRLAEPLAVPDSTRTAQVAVVGRTAIDGLLRRSVDQPVVALVPSIPRVAGVQALHAAARAHESRLEVLHLTAVGVGVRYLDAVARRAAEAGWTAREIMCLVSEVELRMTAWAAGPRLPLGGTQGLLPRRRNAVMSSGRWRSVPAGHALPDEMLDRGLARAGTILAALSGRPASWAEDRLAAWQRAGAVGGRLDSGLARDLSVSWALELVVAPTLSSPGLSTLREQIASAPSCGWCRLPVLGTACPRCALETAP